MQLWDNVKHEALPASTRLVQGEFASTQDVKADARRAVQLRLLLTAITTICVTHAQPNGLDIDLPQSMSDEWSSRSTERERAHTKKLPELVAEEAAGVVVTVFSKSGVRVS